MPFRFEGLEIWALARQFVAHIYEVTARFPAHERYALADQLNQAADSVVLNIAEVQDRIPMPSSADTWVSPTARFPK